MALARLEAGNARFAAGTPQHAEMTARALALENGQSPYAVVLGCSDSRVPIEIVFDQEPGDLFVVRVAGNFLNDDNLASVEFGVALLGAKLVVVLGHTRCGALTAAVDYCRSGTLPPGHIAKLVESLAPIARAAQSLPGDWVANAIERNVAANVAALTALSPILAAAVAAGEVEVAGGIYDLGTGRVTFA